MNTDNLDAAILYCRVSTKGQDDDGTGNPMQEHRCRQHAALRGLPVEAVFTDKKTGFGDFMQRPGMRALLDHLKKNKKKRYVVIFDDLKRFARHTRFYWELRDRLEAYNAVVDCPNFRFDSSPEGEFNETIVVAGGQLERQQQRRQVIQKMTARVEQGYAVTAAPIGYCYERRKGEGALLVPDERYAPIVREALEGYASGRFELQAEVQRFLESHPAFPRDKSGKRKGRVNESRVTQMLKNPTYAGLVSAPYWGVPLHKGLHEPLISVETYQKIQDRLAGGKRAPARRDLSEDFPLRGFVHCTCAVPLTAGWSKGKYKRYPYYLCPNRACPTYGKSIARDKLEGEFETLLKSLRPTESLFRVTSGMFRCGWDMQRGEAASQLDKLRLALKDTEHQIGVLLDKIVEAKSPAVFGAIEQRIDLLTVQKLEMQEKIANHGKPAKSFDDSLRTSLLFLSNPWKLWSFGRLDCRRATLKLAFSHNLQYARNEGFRTPDWALPFKVLAQIQEPETEMVLPVRIELTTSALPNTSKSSS